MICLDKKRQKSGASIGRNSTRHTVKREIYESTEWENCAVAGYKKTLFSGVFRSPEYSYSIRRSRQENNGQDS